MRKKMDEKNGQVSPKVEEHPHVPHVLYISEEDRALLKRLAEALEDLASRTPKPGVRFVPNGSW